MKPLHRPGLLLALFLLLSSCAAYPEVLFARLSSTPTVPQPGEPFALEVMLTDSDGEEVVGLTLVARVVEAYAEVAVDPGANDAGSDAQESEYPEARLLGSARQGVYQGELGPLPAGSYRISLVEPAADREAATASGVLTLDGSTPVELALVLPASGGGLGSWVVWLVGLPLLAAVLVTLLLLTARKDRAD
ncbi:MAG: hypothetical protein WD273_01290 [Trueperaceae bacterium]